MRSELVFRALQETPNRFQLARLAFKATRLLHKPGTRIQDTTNDVLVWLRLEITSHPDQSDRVMASDPVARTSIQQPDHSSLPESERLSVARIAVGPRSQIETTRPSHVVCPLWQLSRSSLSVLAQRRNSRAALATYKADSVSSGARETMLSLMSKGAVLPSEVPGGTVLSTPVASPSVDTI